MAGVEAPWDWSRPSEKAFVSEGGESLPPLLGPVTTVPLVEERAVGLQSPQLPGQLKVNHSAQAVSAGSLYSPSDHFCSFQRFMEPLPHTSLVVTREYRIAQPEGRVSQSGQLQSQSKRHCESSLVPLRPA